MKFAKLIIVSIVMIFSLQYAHADILTDKSTYIGNAVNPDNPFVVCAVQKSATVAYGNTRKIMAYANSAPVGDKNPPEIAMIVFVTQNNDTAERSLLQLHLKSLDKVKNWQYVSASSGEIYLFSTQVSSIAELIDAQNKLIAQVDISECN